MIKIKPFLKNLIRQNTSYIGGFLFFFILDAVVLSSGISRINKVKNNINVLKKDVHVLKTKMDLLNYIVQSSSALEENVAMLNSLIPNSEDYFSVIYSLEELSKKSNFMITSYSVDIKKTTKERLKIQVTGSGEISSFLSFLENYNFGGGRLITSDKIELNPEKSSDIIINLTFYSKKTSLDINEDIRVSPSTIEELEVIKSKTTFVLKSADKESSLDLNYPISSDPF